MSKKNERREKIRALVLERGAISVGALAELFAVSMQTIRRDIATLGNDKGLRRVHGRVELNEQYLNTSFDERTGTNLSGKRAIGAAAARLIPDGSTLFISIGSTPLAVARALQYHRGLTVITNNLSAAMALSEEVSNRIILPGGELRLPDRDILGSEVLAFFSGYRAEFGVFGAAGVATDGSLLEFHSAEVELGQRIRENAQRSILAIDHSKFGRLAPALGPNIREIDHVVLDQRPDPIFDPLLQQLGGRLVLARREEP